MGSSVILPTPGQPKEGPDPNFVSASQPRVATFQFSGMSPQAPAYVRADNVLQVSLLSSVVCNVRVTGRIILADGSVSGFSQDYVTNGTKALQTQFIPLYEGFLQSVNAIILTGATPPKRGQLAVEIAIAAGSAVAALKEWTLFSDYLCSGNSLSWPGSRIQQNVESRGVIRSVQQANPAAGADWIYTVPGTVRQSFMIVFAKLSASAVVANRNVSFIIDDGANQLYQFSVTTAITASQIVNVSATGLSSQLGIQPFAMLLGFPPLLVLAAGFRIRSSTANLDAGDQWSAISLLLEEWIEV